jgi:hypothetical protein
MRLVYYLKILNTKTHENRNINNWIQNTTMEVFDKKIIGWFIYSKRIGLTKFRFNDPWLSWHQDRLSGKSQESKARQGKVVYSISIVFKYFRIHFLVNYFHSKQFANSMIWACLQRSRAFRCKSACHLTPARCHCGLFAAIPQAKHSDLLKCVYSVRQFD